MPCITGSHEANITDYTALAIGSGQVNQSMNLEEVSRTLDCMHEQQGVLIRQPEQEGMTASGKDVFGTLQAIDATKMWLEDQTAFNGDYWIRPGMKTIVRRLTPTECQRLQGFPDGWDIEDAADTKKYRMWGNGMAFPVVLHICSAIDMCEKGEL